MPKLAVSRIEWPIECVAEVVGRDDAEGADRGQRARLGAPEGVIVVAEMDVLAIHAARKADAFHEYVARIHGLPLARV
jgi:hypothetical protein